MGRSTISMAIFNSKLLVYERVSRKITYFERSPPTEILSDRYSDILSGILCILSDILSGIDSDILSGM